MRVNDPNLPPEDEVVYDDEADFAALGADEAEQPPPPKTLADQPMFQTLFAQSIDPTDDENGVLADFAQYVVGPLSYYFGMKAAKGGAFFRQKEQEGASNTERYSRDQTLRAHLINGMLPARRIARLLHRWGAQPMRDWDETVERLFIAGYMMHDFLKIPEAQAALRQAGFETYFKMSA
ncbi:MAG TPA: hypothetical protein VK003_21690, partial [Oceanobacillus sp.]|nr:hypothetical protein [Oceanobacillus sp.]